MFRFPRNESVHVLQLALVSRRMVHYVYNTQSVRRSQFSKCDGRSLLDFSFAVPGSIVDQREKECSAV